jgi:VanZ like family/Concanavalin A-like lectin/glucanases superfamily
MKTQFLDVICLAVLCVVLTLGLWPFHSPKNEVIWLGNHNGLRFGKWSTVISSSAFPMTSAESGAFGSIEVWLQPRRIWDSSTFLAFCTPGNPSHFSLRQSEADLELRVGTRDHPHSTSPARLYVVNAFRTSGPVFVTVTSGVQGTAVYTDGVLARMTPRLRLSTKGFTGRLVLGDSPGQPDNWSGQLLGLAIYRRELTAAQVQRHYETWTHGEKPEISEEELNIALYLFGERGGNVVHNQAKSRVDLYIPEKYVVLDKIFLEPFWKEFSLPRSYWGAVFKNIVGFIPFGLCFCACLSAHKVRRAAQATVILGSLVSLTIEVLQAYLPTRDSGTTDLFTNTIGTYIGVIACRAVTPILAARLPRLPFVASPR